MKLIMTIKVMNAMRTLPGRDREALPVKIRQFAENPYDRYPWAKAFDSVSGRIRHGDWRDIYDIDKNILTVKIIQVGHRKEVYR